MEQELKNPPREFTQDANGNSGYQDLTEQRTAANPLEPGIPVTIGGGEVNICSVLLQFNPAVIAYKQFLSGKFLPNFLIYILVPTGSFAEF